MVPLLEAMVPLLKGFTRGSTACLYHHDTARVYDLVYLYAIRPFLDMAIDLSESVLPVRV